MRDRRLLYLDAHQLSALLWQSGELADEGVFAANADGLRKFSDYLGERGKSVFTILVNSSEESFHTERIPFLRGTDRRNVVERKLGQLFFNKALTASLSLGYEKSTRKDERVLFAALNDANVFVPWLAAIKAAGGTLSGIYSLPLLVPVLLKKLRIAPQRSLFLSIQDQSIRQSYLEAGELNFSRLAPLPDAGIATIAQAFSTETQTLRQYLASQRLIGRKEMTTAFVLAHEDALPDIAARCVDNETIHYQFIGIEECAQKIAMKILPASSHCEALFLHLLASSPPKIQFANDAQRHGYHLARIESLLLGAGALALSACLLVSLQLTVETREVGEAAVALASEAALSRQRYQDIVQTFPPLATTTESLRQVFERHQRLAQVFPDRLFRELGDALETLPEVEIEAIDWNAGAGSTAAPASPAPATPAGNGGNVSEAIVLRGTLKLAPDVDARRTLAVFDKLVLALNANPALRVEIVKRPFDIGSAQALKGGDESTEQNPPRAFALNIARRAS
jgi:hypothetical protein